MVPPCPCHRPHAQGRNGGQTHTGLAASPARWHYGGVPLGLSIARAALEPDSRAGQSQYQAGKDAVQAFAG